ncbi:MAG: glycosyltransferase family 39 protein [Lachnospiraceae bacterium]|nr:glycosyltransferase family 39 protein [Lachnospiraceae bacterium]
MNFYLIYDLIAGALILSFCICALIRRGQKDHVKTLNNASLSALINKYHPVLLFLIFAVFLFSRLFRLAVNPAGIHLDEIGISYDAFSLLHFGTDRMGRAYPVYPTNFGDGNSAMYTYLEMLSLRFLPFSAFSMRLPAVICALPCFFSSYGILYEIRKDRLFALWGPILVTITPYFFSSERWGLDCNLMLSFITVSLYFLIRASNSTAAGKADTGLRSSAGSGSTGRDSETERNTDTRCILRFVIAGIMLGLTLYTYILSYLMIPLFILMLAVYLVVRKKFKLSWFIALCLPIFLLGIPLLIQQLVSMGLIRGFHFLFSDFLPLPAYRASEISLRNIPGNLINIFRLILGGDPLTFNCFREFGPLLRLTVPLIIVGIISVIKEARAHTAAAKPLCIISLYGLSVYFVSLLLSGFNTYNSNSIYIVFVILTAEGIHFVVSGSKTAGRASHTSTADRTSDTSAADDIPMSSGTHTANDTSGICSSFRLKFEHLALTVICGTLLLSFLLYSEFYFRRQGNVYGIHPVFMSTEPGDILRYAEKIYAPDHDRDIYIEVNYSERDYSDLLIALFTEKDPALWRKYEEEKQAGNPDPVLDNIHMKFPEEYDENENAVYILGTDWGHIAAYLIDTGWNQDTAFPGYTILYR